MTTDHYLIYGSILLFHALIVIFFWKRYVKKIDHNEIERTTNRKDIQFIIQSLKDENEKLKEEIADLLKLLGR